MRLSTQLLLLLAVKWQLFQFACGTFTLPYRDPQTNQEITVAMAADQALSQLKQNPEPFNPFGKKAYFQGDIDLRGALIAPNLTAGSFQADELRMRGKLVSKSVKGYSLTADTIALEQVQAQDQMLIIQGDIQIGSGTEGNLNPLSGGRSAFGGGTSFIQTSEIFGEQNSHISDENDDKCSEENAESIDELTHFFKIPGQTDVSAVIIEAEFALDEHSSAFENIKYEQIEIRLNDQIVWSNGVGPLFEFCNAKVLKTKKNQHALVTVVVREGSYFEQGEYAVTLAASGGMEGITVFGLSARVI